MSSLSNHDHSTQMAAIRRALEHAEKTVIEASLHQGFVSASLEHKVRALEDALVGVCAVLRELVEFMEQSPVSREASELLTRELDVGGQD